MEINCSIPTNFQSRKIDMAQAREVCSLMQQRCSYPSYWKCGNIESYKIIYENSDVNIRYRKLSELAMDMKPLGDRLDNLRDFYLKYAREPFKYFSKLMEGIKKFQTLNCGEAARLTYMVCRMNDIAEEDTKVVNIEIPTNEKNQEMDHAITKIKGESAVYGIDALLNETNSLGNLAKTYKNKYAEVFRIPADATIHFVEQEIPKLTDEEAKELAKKYPELLLGGGK